MLTFLGSSWLAGCVGTTGFLSGGDHQRRITVAEVDEVPARYSVDLGAEMVEEVSNNADPARVRVTLTNTGDRSFTVTTGWPKVFGGLVSDEVDPGLLLVAPEYAAPMRDPDCRKPLGSYSIQSSAVRMSLDPATRKSITFEIWGQSDNDSSNCLPEGTYTFSSEYDVGSDDNTFNWGFSLAVDRME